MTHFKPVDIFISERVVLDVRKVERYLGSAEMQRSVRGDRDVDEVILRSGTTRLHLAKLVLLSFISRSIALHLAVFIALLID